MKLFFRHSGEGRPLIVLHGLFGMSDNWMTLSKKFAEAGFSVFATDARNHGQSPWSDEFNYSVMVEDMLEFMDKQNIPAASLIGHSMGGKTAMFFSCLHPDRVENLIVADMAPRAYPPGNLEVIAAIRNVNLPSVSSRKEAELELRQSLSEESTIQFILKSLHRTDTGYGWRFNIEAIKKNINAMGDALPDNLTYNGPTLFLRGERSGYITDEDTTGIKKHFPGSEIKTIPSAGHWIHAENPDAFMQAALGFLQ